MQVPLNVAIFAMLAATIRQAVPITLGAMSGITSERSGIVNIAIEGMMLAAAFSAYMMNVSISKSINDAVAAGQVDGVIKILQNDNIRLSICVFVGMLTGGLLGLFHAILSIRFKVDQIISGTVINLLAFGGTGYFYDQNATTNGKIPHFIFIIVGLMTFWLFHTVWGLRTRAIGENPQAADTLGINVYLLQYTNLFISGVLAGLAGTYLTMADVGNLRKMASYWRDDRSIAFRLFDCIAESATVFWD